MTGQERPAPRSLAGRRSFTCRLVGLEEMTTSRLLILVDRAAVYGRWERHTYGYVG